MTIFGFLDLLTHMLDQCDVTSCAAAKFSTCNFIAN